MNQTAEVGYSQYDIIQETCEILKSGINYVTTLILSHDKKLGKDVGND